MKTGTETLNFDQLSNHRFCAEILRRIAPNAASILDIGSGSVCSIHNSLPGWNTDYRDLLGHSYSNGLSRRLCSTSLPWKTAGQYPVVSCLDTLGLLPAEERSAFLGNLSETASQAIVLTSVCCDDRDALATDSHAAALYYDAVGEQHHSIARHQYFGYPKLVEVQSTLQELGWHVQVWGQGNSDWRKQLTPLLWLNGLQPFQKIVDAATAYFMTHLAPLEHFGPTYRRVFLATRSPMEISLDLDCSDDARANASRHWEQLQSILPLLLPGVAAKLYLESEREIDRLTEQLRDVQKQHREIQTELKNIKSSRVWKLTYPMRTARRVASQTKRLIRKSVDNLKHSIRPAPAVAPATLSASDATASNADFLVFGVIPWHLRFQRPQHFCCELTKLGHRVFYLSPHFVENHKPGFHAEQLDTEGRLFDIRLHLPKDHSIYEQLPSDDQVEQLRRSLRSVLNWSKMEECEAIVQHPFWLRLAEQIPNSRMIYDCMDHMAGFDNTGPELIEEETLLQQEAAMIVATARDLFDQCQAKNPSTVLIQNGCEYEHFANRPAVVYRDSKGRRVIGYYGAIAEWFDSNIIRDLAKSLPDCLILLVGADFCGLAKSFTDLENVVFVGEVPYKKLPYYLYAMDVCIIPFLINDLTRATNPVKAYEYLCSGKPVVSTALPELEFFDRTVDIAHDSREFVMLVRNALEEPAESTERTRRRLFAEGQTWTARVKKFRESLAELEAPRVSVVVVTYNNVDLTRRCVESIFDARGYRDWELIVVDNASSDETPTYLTHLENTHDNVRVILNDTNRGFSAANNQGLRVATGDYLVLLNNDTVVTNGWLRTMVNHLRREPSIGILGPVTNNIGNEAKIELAYDSLESMPAAAASYIRQHTGEVFEIPVLGFFCVMIPREVYLEVGNLDEQFGLGFFEDDDYCKRVRLTGRRIVCAEDVFIHHELSASFNQVAQQRRQQLFETNKSYYESKWGSWTPHSYRKRAA